MVLPLLRTRTMWTRNTASVWKRTATTAVLSSNFDTTNSVLWGTAAIAATVAISAMNDENSKTKCSGIAAVVGSGSYDARHFLLEGLDILKARGCDSAGLVTVSEDHTMNITKYGSGDAALSPEQVIALVRQHSHAAKGPVGMAHTRWATHGARSDQNAHPIRSGKIAVVHNGVLHNARVLRKQLQGYGHVFETETDTEVMAKLIDYYYQKLQKQSESSSTHLLKAATEKALRKCDGTWGLVVMCQDVPDELVVAAHGSPLVIGMTSTGGAEVSSSTRSQPVTYVASEINAFRRFTQTFVDLKDGEVGVIQASGPILESWSSLRVEALNDSQQDDDFQANTIPEPYPDWTLKEIYEQPEAIGRALGFGGRLSGTGRILLGGMDAHRDQWKHVKHLILSGVSSSLHAARYGELLMKQIAALNTVRALDAVDTDYHDFPHDVPAHTMGCCVVSESGERKEALRVSDLALTRMGVPCMSVTNSVGSTLARTTKVGVYCHAGRERSAVSTKSFVSEVTSLALLALWFRQTKEEENASIKSRLATLDVEALKESLLRLPMAFGMALKTHEQCKELAAALEFTDTCFVLGKGFAEPVAREGAFKFQELASLHAEGLSASSFKHASLALVEPPIMYRQRLKTRMVQGKRKKTERMKTTKKKNVAGTPVVLILLDDQHRQSVRNTGMEIKSRGGQVIVITDKPELAAGLDDNPIVIPSNGPLTALGAVVPLQLLAYELAKVRGINPDSPRHMSKEL
ncbi:glucosamine--fructose-6-phosphate aminotransferase [Fistulifera solaris]|uniref:glutamine--fructose-6-phosphate transaminase (isomerizing) n=1 Tax=Fistulifera solaris TaxID=1519565 RepID=A0A1Z5K6T9_FISSO|nr:glucosamine--fructose-6-phosphate aminotransferase [Fistulifera solaris]|eukprot:GAX21939.1 glucosamine--fructose-6-phosphate aminotransferase [Fistulifera solaris]